MSLSFWNVHKVAGFFKECRSWSLDATSHWFGMAESLAGTLELDV